jgi:quercetin dioxygenase-like cupin family protein
LFAGIGTSWLHRCCIIADPEKGLRAASGLTGTVQQRGTSDAEKLKLPTAAKESKLHQLYVRLFTTNKSIMKLKTKCNEILDGVWIDFLKQIKNTGLNICIAICLLLYILTGCKSSPAIIVQSMEINTVTGNQTSGEELLPGEIAGTRITHISLTGPLSQTVSLSKDSIRIFLFMKGRGTLRADTASYQVEPETIAVPFTFGQITLDVAAGEVLHLLQFTKILSAQDIEELKNFPAENKYDIYFKKFSDCEPYTEKIKSPNTVSRTVLPGDIIPRVALGTVEAKGPDAVGAHEHPMLDQLFLGLTGNDITVHADDRSTGLKAYSLLHIPIGSSHWATVDKGKKMYYLWMDFFLTKEGQEWLKTHKPVSKKMN